MSATVKLRAPRPPHEQIAELAGASDISYGRMLMEINTASFRLSRADPNLAEIGHLLHPDDDPPMFTIERPDGLHPWVGFLSTYRATQSDPMVDFTLSDHAWRMKHARTEKRGSPTLSAGDLIVQTLRAADARAEPALWLDLTGIEGGPAIKWAMQLDNALDFLEGVAEASGWEWGFEYHVSPEQVTTRLAFREFIGSDRANEIVLDETSHLADIEYSIEYEQGIANAIALGGTGPAADRIAAAASRSGAGADVDTVEAPSATRHGLGGTRIITAPQVRNKEALFAAARRLHTAPQYAIEKMSFQLLEAEVDMARFGTGDIVRVRMVDTDLGQGLERSVRVLGINYDPHSGQHKITPQVLRDD